MAAVSRADVLAVLGSLTPQELYELGIGGRPAGPTSDTPKLTIPLDKVSEKDIPAVVDACRRGLRYAAEGGPDHDAHQFLAQVAPQLAAEVARNSAYRRKPIIHSLRVCAEYLQSPEAAAKRAAAKLRVPPTTQPVVRRKVTAAGPQGTFLVPPTEETAPPPPADPAAEGAAEDGADQ